MRCTSTMWWSWRIKSSWASHLTSPLPLITVRNPSRGEASLALKGCSCPSKADWTKWAGSAKTISKLTSMRCKDSPLGRLVVVQAAATTWSKISRTTWTQWTKIGWIKWCQTTTVWLSHTTRQLSCRGSPTSWTRTTRRHTTKSQCIIRWEWISPLTRVTIITSWTLSRIKSAPQSSSRMNIKLRKTDTSDSSHSSSTCQMKCSKGTSRR